MSSDNSNITNENTSWQSLTVSRTDRESLNGHKSAILWFTGLSGSGKSTISNAVEAYLHKQGARTFVLDGDNATGHMLGKCEPICHRHSQKESD